MIFEQSFETIFVAIFPPLFIWLKTMKKEKGRERIKG